jgi:hypothetical protein
LISFASVGSQLLCVNNSNVVAKIIRQGRQQELSMSLTTKKKVPL